MTTTDIGHAPRGADGPSLVGSSSDLFKLPLRGRQIETAIVDSAVRDVGAGMSRTLVFRGVAGVGKTRLLGEVLAAADDLDWGTVLAVPEPGSHLVPTAVLVEAALGANPPLLGPSDIEPFSGDPDSRYWLTHKLRNALEAEASERSVAVVVDDLQWVDSASLAILRALAVALADMPILWVVAVRSGDHGHAVNTALAAFAQSGTVVEVEPLPDAAVGDMAADLLGATPDARLTRALSRAENLPLLVSELVNGLVEENLVTVVGDTATADEATMPERFGSSIRERIDHLPDDVSRLVQAASTLGRTFTIANLTELLGVEVDDLMRGIDRAVASDLFEDGATLGFRHDAIRETAEAMLSTSMRAYLRRRAADIRVRSGEPLLAVAASVADSAGRGDAAAVVLLHDAALQLVASDAGGAAALARRGVELSTAAGDAALLAELIPVLWAGGEAEFARGLAERLDRSLAPEERARVQLAVARLETESSFSDAIGTSDAALAIDGISSATRAQLLAVRALNLANVGDPARLVPALAEAREVAAAAGERGALATVNATESVLRFYQHRFDDATQLIDAAVEQLAGDPDFVAAQWLPEGLWPAFLANSVGECARALSIAEQNIDDARRTRSAVATAYWTMLKSRVLFDLGDLAEAKSQAEAVMAMAEELGLGDFAQATAGVVLYRVALHEGDNAACQAGLVAVRAMVDGPALHLAGTWLLALTADAGGDTDAVRALTADAHATLGQASPSMTTPADFGDDARLAGMWKRGGADDRLVELVAVTAARAAANPDNVLARGIDEHVRGIAEGSVGVLRAAVDTLRRGERPLLLAAALEDLGVALVESDQPGADRSWGEAVDLFENHGATRDAGRVLKRLRDVGVRRRPKAALDHHGVLSSRELDVAQRLARGSTTRQVASDLSLSHNTVLTHVRHVYEKWGISNRRALVERVSRRPDRLG
jgi:DNA-binding NarL/FixJ family response regulator